MKRIFIFLIIFALQANICYGLNWKYLHEEADRRNLPYALASIQSSPDNIDDLYILGLIYLNEHKDQEASQSFNRILSLDPDTKEAQWGVAEVLRRRHDLEKAEAILNELIVLNPDFSPAYISLAYIKYIKMDFDKSVKLAYKVLRQGVDNVDLSNYVRAYLLVAGGKGMIAHYGGPVSKVLNGTAVMPNLKKAARLQSDNAGVMFGLGSFYLLAPALAGGDLDKVEQYYKKAIELDPLFADVYVRLAQFHKRKGNNSMYQIYLDKALEIDPGNELALDIKNRSCKFICFKGSE
ncbi:MAG: TRAP transporter TatT component family protein [Candidatus Omnitrophota bacterium]